MRILFIGCVESSYRFLLKLIENNKEIVGVITKEKSDYNSDFYDLSTLCGEHRIPYYYVKNINDVDSMEFIQIANPEIGFCFGWSQLLKDEIIDLFPMGVVGFHPAALPNNRGRHPLIWALVLGLQETASTFFMIDAGADEGAIISQQNVQIDYEDDARTLYNKVLDIAVMQELEIVNAFESGTVEKTYQNKNEGNSWRKRGKADGQIDWRMSSKSIYNLVRGLTKPYAGAHFIYAGNEYKVWKVEEVMVEGCANIEPGKVLRVYNDGAVEVKVGDNVVRMIDFDKVSLKKGEYIL